MIHNYLTFFFLNNSTIVRKYSDIGMFASKIFLTAAYCLQCRVCVRIHYILCLPFDCMSTWVRYTVYTPPKKLPFPTRFGYIILYADRGRVYFNFILFHFWYNIIISISFSIWVLSAVCCNLSCFISYAFHLDSSSHLVNDRFTRFFASIVYIPTLSVIFCFLLSSTYTFCGERGKIVQRQSKTT